MNKNDIIGVILVEFSYVSMTLVIIALFLFIFGYKIDQHAREKQNKRKVPELCKTGTQERCETRKKLSCVRK